MDGDAERPEEASSGPTSGAGGPGSGSAADGAGAGPAPREEAALRRARGMSRLLDEAVRIPGTRFRVGLDPILGVVPAGGDAVAAALSLYPVAEAYRLGVSRGTLAKMLALVALDAVVGSIPVIGPVFDAFLKVNEWNVGALERHVRTG